MITKIPIDEAIQTGSWLTCENDDCRLKIRLDAIREMETEAVAARARKRGKEAEQAKAVILYLTIVNACNTLLMHKMLEKILRIIDQQGCDYPSLAPGETPSHDCLLDGRGMLAPEESVEGSMTFMLPAGVREYYFGILEGNIQEE